MALALLAWTAPQQAGAQVLPMPPSMLQTEPTVIDGPILDSPALGVADLGQVPDSAALVPGPALGVDFNVGGDPLANDLDTWQWQAVPQGLLYHPYLAGPREPRMAAQFVHERSLGWLLDGTLGAQFGVLRYGSRSQPEGWQLDAEGAAFPRLWLDDHRTLVSSDFRVGVPLTFRRGMFESRFGAYHLSSHLSDRYTVQGPWWPLDYSRDALVWGIGLRPLASSRIYAEAEWAFHTTGASKPWQFQFGYELSSTAPTSLCGSPFFAVHGVLREEVDYGGNVIVQTGWQWRAPSAQLLRAGFHYMNGKSNQAQFFNKHEEQIGMGLWYDF